LEEVTWQSVGNFRKEYIKHAAGEIISIDATREGMIIEVT
jgi:hypothetical protein